MSIIPFDESTTKDNNNTKEGQRNTKPSSASPTTLSSIAQQTTHSSKTIAYEYRKRIFNEKMSELEPDISSI